MTKDDLMHVATALHTARRAWTADGLVPLSPSVRRAFDSITAALWSDLDGPGHGVSLPAFHAAANPPATDTGARETPVEPAEVYPLAERPPLVDEFRGGHHTAARLREMARDQRQPPVDPHEARMGSRRVSARVREALRDRRTPDPTATATASGTTLPIDYSVFWPTIRRSIIRFGQNGDPT